MGCELVNLPLENSWLLKCQDGILKMPFLEIILRNIRISDIFLHSNDHYVQKCLLPTLQKNWKHPKCLI